MVSFFLQHIRMGQLNLKKFNARVKAKILLVLFTFPAITLASGNGVYGVSKVGCTTTDGGCWISLASPIPSSINNCTSGYETRFMISDPGSSAVLSIALTAYSSNKKLEIYIQDGANCIGAYPKAVHVSIMD